MKRLFEIICQRINPIKYAKKIGVKLNGKNIAIAPNVSFGTEPYLISIGENTFISAKVCFVNHDGGMHVLRNIFNKPFDKFGEIRIGKNCFIGNNVTILQNVEIGDNVIVGYGSIVTKNIPSNEVWAGVPAHKIETIDEYYEKNKGSLLLTKNMKPSKKRAIIEETFNCLEKRKN